MSNATITFGAVCQYGKSHNWWIVDWQIIPDARGFDVCTYSLEITYNVIPIILTIIILGAMIVYVYKRHKNKNKE